MAKSIFGLVHTLLGGTGLIEPGATIEFYSAGTTTPLTVYSDRALSTTAGTSVTADAAGVVPERWIGDSTDIKLVYKDASGSTRYTRDYFNDSLNSTLLANIAALNGTNGYFIQFTGAATVQAFNLFNTENTWTGTQITQLLKPSADSTYDLGQTATRWSVVYADELELRPSASRTPAAHGDLSIEATNNTTLTFKFKGSDGTVRSGTVTLS